MTKSPQYRFLGAFAAVLASPLWAGPMAGKQFTDTFNAAIDGTVSPCLVPERKSLLGQQGELDACLAAADHAEDLARRSDPATAGIYRMVEYFSLTGVAGTMTRIDKVRLRRACQIVAKRNAVMTSIDLSLYDEEVQGQLEGAFKGSADLYALCRSEFPGL